VVNSATDTSKVLVLLLVLALVLLLVLVLIIAINATVFAVFGTDENLLACVGKEKRAT